MTAPKGFFLLLCFRRVCSSNLPPSDKRQTALLRELLRTAPRLSRSIFFRDENINECTLYAIEEKKSISFLPYDLFKWNGMDFKWTLKWKQITMAILWPRYGPPKDRTGCPTFISLIFRCKKKEPFLWSTVSAAFVGSKTTHQVAIFREFLKKGPRKWIWFATISPLAKSNQR